MACFYLNRARARTSTGNESAGTCVPSAHTNATAGAGATSLGHAALDTGGIIWAVPYETAALGGAARGLLATACAILEAPVRSLLAFVWESMHTGVEQDDLIARSKRRDGSTG